MSGMPEFRILPMDDRAAGELQTFWWWSTQAEAPYIRGLENTDWGGPFTSLEQATEGIAEIFGEEAAANAKHIYFRDPKTEPQWFSLMTIWHSSLEVSVPLDEFSERALALGQDSPERQYLFKCMRTQILPGADERFSDILMYDSAAELNVRYHRFNREEGVATFALPVVVAFRTKLSLTESEVAKMVVPAVTLDPLYSDIIDASLVPKR